MPSQDHGVSKTRLHALCEQGKIDPTLTQAQAVSCPTEDREFLLRDSVAQQAIAATGASSDGVMTMDMAKTDKDVVMGTVPLRIASAARGHKARRQET
ncbi:MAG: hypothetical protein WD294_06300 [Phycisphaeraceae bacterium]